MPYWSLYLNQQGYTAHAIGELTAILLATRVLAPNIWGWIADQSGQHLQVVRWTSLASIFAFSLVLVQHNYWHLAIILFLFSFFWSAALPQFEALTLVFLGLKTHRYSQIRLWGSIGFIVTVALLGDLLETMDATLVPYMMTGCLIAIWFTSLSVPACKADNSTSSVSLTHLLRRQDVRAFFAICFLIQLSHGPYYTFYTLYLDMHHYPRGLIGQLWALGVIAEVVLFLFIHRYLTRYGLYQVLIASLLLSTLRWLIIGFFPDSIILLVGGQILHAASFGLFHAAAMAWIHRVFNGTNLGRGQALYSSIGFGAGGALGSLISGYIWISPGPTLTFSLAAGMTFLAFLICRHYLHESRPV